MLREIRRGQHASRVVTLGVAREHGEQHSLGFPRQTGVARHACLPQQRIGQRHRRRGIVGPSRLSIRIVAIVRSRSCREVEIWPRAEERRDGLPGRSTAGRSTPPA